MYSKVGIQFQDANLDNLLKVKEIVEEFRFLQKLSKKQLDYWINEFDSNYITF
ncbi:hypothetical protein B808_1055 [Fructilactobacillus florum 8D]|uniref:Uncharacterized protein n=2 Tax=Fructilactobacillus florum TaxID=640331 RepID=W9EK43_9LACO|nr:hypothetical protein B807_607 [Fructilactobacillus florum 2F]ETO40049.1 hypothetical protein B808_1055 [Fructilactobacillus florum 8D]